MASTISQSSTVTPPTPGSQTTQTVVTKIRKRKRRGRTISGILISLVALIAIILFANSHKERTITVQTEKVTRRTITEVVQATGTIQPETQVKVSPEVSGEIIQLPYKEGDYVTKGTLVAKIKPTTFQAAVEQADAGVNAARATAEQSRAAMINAKEELDRAGHLRDKHLISDQDYQSAKAKYDASQAGFNASNFQIKSAESQLSQIKESLNKTSVFAPMTGVITSLISRLGEKVVGTSQFSGTEMMTVSDLSVMNATVDVDENDVVNIKLGDSVKLSIDAFPNQTFHGHVIEIANSAKLKGTGTQDQSTNFTVKVRIDNFGSADLRPGMSCTARIETQTKENVLAVPLMSVTRRDDENTKAADSIKNAQQSNKGTFHESGDTPTVLFIVESGKAKQVSVKTGVSDNSYVEILSGLSGSEEVIKGNFKAVSKDLADKKPVKVDNSANATLGTEGE